MSTFREILAPSATRRIREHNVLHVAADLPAEDDAIQRARREVLLWAQKRNGGHLPRDAMAGKAFDLLAAGRSTSVAVVDLPRSTPGPYGRMILTRRCPDAFGPPKQFFGRRRAARRASLRA